MLKQLLETLQSFGYPVYKQGTLGPDAEYDPAFFTFWNFQGDEDSNYDNNPVACAWGYWVYFYSNDELLFDTVIPQVRKLLKENGFILDGREIDLPSDKITHTGKQMTVYKIETY